MKKHIDWKKLKEYKFYYFLHKQLLPHVYIALLAVCTPVICLLLFICVILIGGNLQHILQTLVISLIISTMACFSLPTFIKYYLNPYLNVLNELSALTEGELDGINREFLHPSNADESFENIIVTEDFIITYRAFCRYNDIIKIERWSGVALSNDRKHYEPKHTYRSMPKEYTHYLIVTTRNGNMNIILFSRKYTLDKIKAFVDNIVSRCDHEVEITGGHVTRY